jgi:hypothetical protein
MVVKVYNHIKLRIVGILNIFLLLRRNRVAHGSKEIFILPHLGYGDLITCMPIFLNMADSGKRINVFSPSNAIPLLLKMKGNHDIKFFPIEEYLSEDEFQNVLMIHRASKVAKRHGIPVLTLGYDLLWLSLKIRPDMDINTFFYRLARVPLGVYRKFEFGHTIREDSIQAPIPRKPYALVDHFPGTVREIDATVFEEIQGRGLELVFNPRDIKYENLIDLIENADELHLVNSSLLCVALLLNNRASRKVVYPINKNFYPGLYFYDLSWDECAMSSEIGIRYQRPLKIDRQKEHDLLIQKSQSLHLRFLDHLFFRRYPAPYLNQK